jgi:hypothetical protein
MDRLQIDTGRTCWSGDYLLAHCDGYRIGSGHRTLGYVQEIVRCPDGGPLALRVAGAGGTTTVCVADVVELHPNDESLLVGEERSLA